jgi:hypothetical protein
LCSYASCEWTKRRPRAPNRTRDYHFDALGQAAGWLCR